MADIIVKLAINPTGEGKIGAISSNYSQLLNNVSINADNSGVFDVLTDDSFQGTEMLAFNKGDKSEGVLYFNNSGLLSNRKDGEAGKLQSEKAPKQYIWSRTDDNGYALDKSGNIIELVLTIESTGSDVNFDSVVIIGDSVAKQFPVEAYLDDSIEPIYSDDAKWAIKFEENKPNHTIRITRWKRPNYNAVLNAVRVMYKYINIDDKALQSVSSLSETSSDVSTINYGVIANSGDINILDANGEIEDLIRDGILPNSDLELEVQYNGSTIQHHITNDTNYKSDTKEFNLSLTNKIKDLDILIYKGYQYPYEARTLYDVLFDVMNSLLGNKLSEDNFIKMLSNKCIFSFTELNMTLNKELYIYEYLKKINIKYPIIESGKTYREVIDNICTIAQLRMFINDKNEYVFVSAMPVSLSTDKIYLLENKFIMNDIVTDVVVKNKVDAVEINETNILDNIYSTNDAYVNESSVGGYKFENMNGIYIKSSSGAFGSAKMEGFYTDGSFTIPKKQEGGLKEIISLIKLSEPDDDGFYSVGFTTSVLAYQYNGTVYNKDKLKQDIMPYNDTSVFATTNYSDNFYFEKKNDEWITSIPTKSKNGNAYVGDVSLQTNLIDKSYVKVKELDDKYECVYHILTKVVEYFIFPYTNGDYYISSDMYESKSLIVNIKGEVRKISFENISASSPNIELSKHKTFIQSNNLLQNGTVIEGQKISNIIKNNITAHYKNGIQSKEIQIVCANLKNHEGEVVINKENGNIINPLDIIFTKGDIYSNGSQKYWRVFSREFIYDGEPYIKLNCEQVIKINVNGGLYDNNDNIVKTWEQLVSDGDIVIKTLNNGDLSLNSISNKLEGGLFIDYSISNIENVENLALNKIVVPNGVKTIGSFKNSNIREISLPETIENVGDGAFDGCNNLKFNQYDNALYLGNSNNGFTLIIKPINKDIKNCKIYDKLTKITNGTFKNCLLLEQINIPNGIKIVGDSVFSGCVKLNKVNIPSNVTSLGNFAFSGCISLDTINLYNSIKDIGAGCFSNTGFSVFDISHLSNLRILNSGCFSNCNNLLTVYMPKTLENIASSCFYGCSKLATIQIPKKVKKIETSAFENCTSLVSLSLGGYTSQDEEIELEEIGERAFYNCSKITSGETYIYIPSSCRKIGAFAFYNCTNMLEVQFRDPIGWKVSQNPMTDLNPITPDLSNPENNLILLTKTYSNYTWYK